MRPLKVCRWSVYDAAFRKQPAATGQRDWGKINSSLYTICFTEKAKLSQRCDDCLSAAHKTSECYALGDEELDVAGRVRAVESALLAFSTTHSSPAGSRGRQKSAGLLMKGSATSGAVNTGMPAGDVAALMPVVSAEQGRGRAP